MSEEAGRIFSKDQNGVEHAPEWFTTFLINYAKLLTKLNQLEHAVTVNEETVAILRQLARAWPDKYKAKSASPLNDLARSLSALRRQSEAEAIRREALKWDSAP